MIYPTIESLTKGKFNRYELAVATAKCARLITAEYTRQREAAEKALNKESEKTIYSMVDNDLCNEKAVKLAITRMEAGDFVIVEAKKSEETEAEITEEAEEIETAEESETVEVSETVEESEAE